MLSVVVVAIGLCLISGRYGFNPTDEGYVLAQSMRILDLQVPHVDFITPRPAGSAILHIPDLVLPGPTFIVSRTIAASELLAAGVLFAVADIRGRGHRFVMLGSGIAAGIVNLHLFPFMAWHTIDGIVLVVLGVYLIEGASALTGNVGGCASTT